MDDIAARPNSIPWPPLLYGGAVAIALLLHWIMPSPWFEPPTSVLIGILGSGLALMAIIIDMLVIQDMRRARTAILPTRGASRLLTTGLFALSRNPIYVANTLLVTGIALWLGNLWMLMTCMWAAILTHYLAIRREEDHLAARFGPEWDAYKARTARWLFF
jgi:protein-S-isoprenylcysteine O-methyltransferase Ste14